MTSKEKQEYAFLLYKQNIYTQGQIAEKTGVAVNTITRWKKSYEWDKAAQTLLVTRHEQLRRLYTQLQELNNHIAGKPKGQQFANKSEADTMIQITRSISNLEEDVSASVTIDVLTKFLVWIVKNDPNASKEIAELIDSFIKHTIR